MASFGDGVGNIYVTTNATLIYKGDGLREALSIYNNGTTTVYLGSGTAVTVANGYPVPAASECHWLGISDVYGIVAGGSADVRYHNVA